MEIYNTAAIIILVTLLGLGIAPYYLEWRNRERRRQTTRTQWVNSCALELARIQGIPCSYQVVEHAKDIAINYYDQGSGKTPREAAILEIKDLYY